MNVDQLYTCFLGSSLWSSSRPINGVVPTFLVEKRRASRPYINFLYKKWREKHPGTSFPQFSGLNVNFDVKSFDSRCHISRNCSWEPWYKSFISAWKEGIFLFRCSVFVAVISAAGLLVWYAQLKATSFVETHLLPSVCTVLGDYIKREITFGNIRSISPMGITLQSCAIGPHTEEFSCLEMPTVKIRIRPFATMRKRKIVIDAVLYEPTILVAQKEDFSWLQIPSSSANVFQRHRPTEEGIDHRTKTRRIAREEVAARIARDRAEAAREAAEKGYIVPQGNMNISLKDNFKYANNHPITSDSSGLLFCMDEQMLWKDHHAMDTGTDYVVKHADLEKSFGVSMPGSGFSICPKVISHLLKPKSQRVKNKNLISEAGIISKQRILRRSAVAAFASLSGKHYKSSYDKDAPPLHGRFKDDGLEKIEAAGDQYIGMKNAMLTNSQGHSEFFELDGGQIIQQSLETADGCLTTERNLEVPNAENPENKLLPEENPATIQNFRPDIGESIEGFQNPIYKPLDKKYKDKCQDYSALHPPVSIWPFILSVPLLRFPKIIEEVFVDCLVGQINKLKSSLAVRREGLTSELTEGLTQVCPEGIEKVLPITLESVQFTGGTLMLLGYGDKEPREMVNAKGHIKFQNYYSRVHVHVSGDCREWRTAVTTLSGGQLSTDVFVDIVEQKWHTNLKIINLFAPLFERILGIPIMIHKGRASGEVHICSSPGDTFPSFHGQLDVTGLNFQILEAPSNFSELAANLCFRGQRIFLHNANGWFGDTPLEVSGDFGINPEEGEFHLMCQVPSVEVNAIMRTLKMRPLLFPLAGSITTVFNCQGPLDAPVFVGSGIVSRKISQTPADLLPSSASEAIWKNMETGAVAAFDRVPFSHLSANFTFNLDNCVVDLYGIRAILLDGGEIRGTGNAWICPEGELDDSAMDLNLSGNLCFEKVMHRYFPEGIWQTACKIGEINVESKLFGSLLKPRFDIKWNAPKAEGSFSGARGDIIISHECITVNSSSFAFELYAKIQASYPDDYWVQKENMFFSSRTLPLIIKGVDVDVRMQEFELANLMSLSPFDSPRPLHLKATGKIKFHGKVMKSIREVDCEALGWNSNVAYNESVTNECAHIVGDISLSGIKINQLILAPQLSGSMCYSDKSFKLDAAGKPDESLSIEVIGSSWFSVEEMVKNESISISLQKGQLRANMSYQPHLSVSLQVWHLPLDELELASLRGIIQKAELQLHFQKRRGHGLLSILQPKFSGVLGETLEVAARWSGDVITVEKSVLDLAGSRYELQGEYVVPGVRDRYDLDKDVGLFKKWMTGNFGSVISSMGRWRLSLEVPNAEVAEMLPLARLFSRSVDPSVHSRSKNLFIQSLQSAGVHFESLHDLLEAMQNLYCWSDENVLEDTSLPGLGELSGRWRGSLHATGGGNGDTMAGFDLHGEDWEWGTYKAQRVIAVGAYNNNSVLRFDQLFIQKDNATLHADGTLLGPTTNLHFAVLNFPVGLVPTLMQIIETSPIDPVHSLWKILTPIKGILHMEGDLRGSLVKPECDVQIRLLDGAIGGIDLGRAEIVASVTPTSRFLFNANFEPIIQSGHVHIQGSIPVTYIQNEDGVKKEKDTTDGLVKVPVWIKQNERHLDEVTEKKDTKEKLEDGWDTHLAESFKGLNWNLLDPEEVRIDADIKDGGMMLITALSPYAKWLHGYADIVIQVRGTCEQPVIDGSASFHRVTLSSPVLHTPLTNFSGMVYVNQNLICISSLESRASRKGKVSIRGNLPVKASEMSAGDKIDLKCQVLEVRAKNVFSGQVDSQLQISGSILQPNISGMIKLSHGEAYLPHDKGNNAVTNRLASRHSTFCNDGYTRFFSSGHVSRSFGSSHASSHNKLNDISGKQQPEIEVEIEQSNVKTGIDVKLTDLKLLLGPELRIVYPLILNFGVSGELELNGQTDPKCIKAKGILTFENGDVNLVAAQVRLKRDHLNMAKFEPELGLDPTLDLALAGSEWQFRIQGHASAWQDNLVVTSSRPVDQAVLSPTEAARVFENQLAESLLEGDGQLAFKKLATATLETLMPRIEGKGELGHARWRLVYAPQIPSLISRDPTADPLKYLASNISFGTEVEVQLGKRLQASIVRRMKDSEMATQWTLIYQLTGRLRVLFQSVPSNRLLFEYSTTSQD